MSMKNYIIGQAMPRLLLSGLFVFAGLSMTSCGDSEDNITIEPYAEHTMKGVIQNQEGKAIPSVQVVIKSNRIGWKNDTIKADDKGAFTKKYKLGGSLDVDYNVIFRDIDGDTNGAYKTDSVKVSFKKDDLKGANGVFLGSAEKEANIKLSLVK